MKTGPCAPRSTVLTDAEEAMVLAFRRHMLLPLDDCLYTLQLSLPHLTRSALHRCPARGTASRTCLIWRGPGRSGRSSNAPPQALASGARTDGAALARSTSTSPGCKPVKYDEDQKALRAGAGAGAGFDPGDQIPCECVFPTNGCICSLASFVRWHRPDEQVRRDRGASTGPTEQQPGNSFSICPKPCPARSIPFSPIEPLKAPLVRAQWRGEPRSQSSPATGTPSPPGRCASR